MKHGLNLLRGSQTLKTLKCTHAHLLLQAPLSDLTLNKIIRLYCRLGTLHYARKVFDQIPKPQNPFLYASIIHGHVENGHYSQALSLFRLMLSFFVPPLTFSICSILKALSKLSRLEDGNAVYALSVKYGVGFYTSLQNSYIDLLMRQGESDLARSVFDNMPDRDMISWNTMVSGHGNLGQVIMAREVFDEMPDRSVVSWTSMICGYIKVGDMDEACGLFESMPIKDSPSWNVMLSGYLDSGNIAGARKIFDAMPFRDVVASNIMVSGLCKAGELCSAIDVFRKMPKRNVFSWTMMLDGYVKAGDINGAKLLFDEMPERNLVSWSTMIGGYAKYGQPRHALEMFDRFKEEGIKPDDTFILEIISACSQLGILDTAEAIVTDFIEPPSFSNLRIATSLIVMYAKCGTIDRALQVFQMAYPKDLLCYSTMIAAFANHGFGQQGICLFGEMKRACIKPDAVTFLGVLSCCNHAGLADEGRRYFKQMTDDFGFQPSEKHFSCMVDILGRAGCLEEAHELIISMPIAPSPVVWGSLLAACRVHRNVSMAEIAAVELFKIESENSGNYVLLSNVYADAGMWKHVAKVRAMIREICVKKTKGSSWIELNRVVHEFVTWDISHTDADRIFLILDLLYNDMRHIQDI